MKTLDTLSCEAMIKEAHKQSLENETAGLPCFIDVEELAKRMGFGLKAFWNPLDTKTLGTLERTAEGFSIGYNRQTCRGVKKYFTIAHEMGHYLKHYHLFASLGRLVDEANPSQILRLAKTTLAGQGFVSPEEYERKWADVASRLKLDWQKTEREADYYATTILIPRWFRERARKEATTDAERRKFIAEARDKFRVSRLTASFSLFKRDIG